MPTLCGQGTASYNSDELHVPGLESATWGPQLSKRAMEQEKANPQKFLIQLYSRVKNSYSWKFVNISYIPIQLDCASEHDWQVTMQYKEIVNVIIESLHLQHLICPDLCSLSLISPFICKCQSNAWYSLYNEKGGQPQEITTPVIINN